MTEPLCLYSLSLQQSSAITQVTSGYFRGRSVDVFDADKLGAEEMNREDLAIVRHGGCNGSSVDLFSVHKTTGMLSRHGLISIDGLLVEGDALLGAPHDVFATIQVMSTLRMQGYPRDLLVIASDTGKIGVLEWQGSNGLGYGERLANKKDNLDGVTRPETALRDARLVCISMRTYGKPGARNNVPGMMMAVDPAGRALILAALDNTKYAFVLGYEMDTRIEDADTEDSADDDFENDASLHRGERRPLHQRNASGQVEEDSSDTTSEPVCRK